MPIKTLGPYRIERRLGHGGMGIVYEGVHEQTGQRVAIKALSENLCADPRFRERFSGEVETLQLLHHENIVQLFGYGEEEDQLFFAMELVDGPSLEAALHAGRRFSWRETAEIAIQVSAALKHAHDHGVIHRDLKPANLLRGSDGIVKLTDFGIAKLFGASGLTLAGSMIGTPDYMSPEQTEGYPATALSDLYSLGCVMYALMTGKPPFSGSSVTEVISRVRSQEAAPLKLLVPGVPDQLQGIVSQLLRKDPAQRLATPQALAHLLQAMLHALAAKPAGPAEVVPPSPAPPPAVPPVDRGTLSPQAVAGMGTAERPTLDFTPEEAKRFEADRSHFQLTHAVGQADSSEGSLTVRATPAPPAPARHFTAVAPGSSLPTRSASPPRPVSRRRDWLITAGMFAILAGILAAFTWALLPPSADRLYQRIQTASAQTPPPLSYSSLLSDFLERYPHDPRADEVQRLYDDQACQDLRDDLLGKVRTLSEAESLYLKGLELAEQDDPAGACECFRKIVADLEAGHVGRLGVTDKRLLARSQYLLRTLDCAPASPAQ